MARLYLPWACAESCAVDQRKVRNLFASSLDLHEAIQFQKEKEHVRSPSLPPINRNQDRVYRNNRISEANLNHSVSGTRRFAFYDEDCEGDTSGYCSETFNHIKGRTLQNIPKKTNELWSDCKRPGSPRSPLSAATDGRPRWGDRGVVTGRLWEPTAPTDRLPQMQNEKKGAPSWVERGLNMLETTPEALVVDQRSSNDSALDCDRSSCNGSDEGRTFLRGQNVHLEPEIKAQRAMQRNKALELQSALLNQLEDRKRRRQEERERQLKEDKLEEIRIKKQMEEDKLKYEIEKKISEEKQFLEKQKLDMLQKAIEEAESKAKSEKEKKFSHYKTTLQSQDQDKSNASKEINIEPKDTYEPTNGLQIEHSDHHENKSENIHPSDTTCGSGNINLFIQGFSPLTMTNKQYNIVPVNFNNVFDDLKSLPLNNVQLALLVPCNLNDNYLNIPLSATNNTDRNSEKTITPRKYRKSFRSTKHISTQTDYNDNIALNNDPLKTKTSSCETQRNLDLDFKNVDESTTYEHNDTKKDRKQDDRAGKEFVCRPKWGVNKPKAQYKKQSEKDPFYIQKRKPRQKYRSQRQYFSQSSDESRSPSPSMKSRIKKRSNTKTLSQTYWKTKGNSMEVLKANSFGNKGGSDMANLYFDQLSIKDNESVGVESSKSFNKAANKRLTLSQKFFNDKYGHSSVHEDEEKKIDREYRKSF